MVDRDVEDIVNVKGNLYKITNKNDIIQSNLIKSGWADHIVNFVRNNDKINANDVCIVIGAHIGTTAIPISKLVKTVYCFEPSKNVFNELIDNIQLNKIQNIHAYNIALGKYNENGYMLDRNNPRIANNSGGNHVLTNDDIIHNRRSSLIVNTNDIVFIRKLDHVLQNIKLDKIDIIIIDVEGMEDDLIEGAHDTIYTFKPKYIICEIWPDIKRKMENMPVTQNQVIDKFSQMGYTMKGVLGDDDFVFEYSPSAQ